MTSFVLRAVLFPILVPVLLGTEASKWLWKQVGSNGLTLVLYAYFFGPLFAILSGIELATHLGWVVGVHWSLWMGALAGYELAFLGLVWPLFVILTKPILYVVKALLEFIFRLPLVRDFDRRLYSFTAALGKLIPFWSYWRNQNGLSNAMNAVVPLLLLGFALLTLVVHLFLFIMPIWTLVYGALGSMAPWMTTLSHLVVAFLVAVAPFLGLGAAHATRFRIRSAKDVFGPAAVAVAFNIGAWSPLRHVYEPTMWVPILVGVYLACFLVVFPVIGILSTRRLLIDLLRYIANLIAAYGRWAHARGTDTTFLEKVNPLLVCATCFASYTIFNFFGFHPIITILHTIFFTAITFTLMEFYVWAWSIDALLVISFSSFSLTAGYHPAFTAAVHAFVVIAGLPLSFFILWPILITPLYFLAKLVPQAALRPINVLRDFVRRTVHAVGRLWESMLSYSFDDRSSFSCTFGWLMTAFLVGVLTIEYGKFYFFSGFSPLLALGSLRNSIDLGLNVNIFKYTPVEHTLDIFGIAAANATTAATTAASVNATASALLNATIDVAKNASLANVSTAFVWSPGAAAAVFGHYFIDCFIFLSALFNLLILLGKAASSGAAPSFALVAFSYTFIRTRITLFTRSHFSIFTQMASVELGFAAAFILAPAIYATLRRITAPFIAKIAPQICIPFERLFSLQQWMFRVMVRQYYNFKDLLGNVWDMLFGKPPPPRTAAPLYQRPRRWG